ncbi:MAG: triphosphoribosyl-dephospho-CoA synthase [Theionarchaea archaeon]|nr:triphosphoribosyl-dephospho-CoA synthase [Theionarchaea archaeon]
MKISEASEMASIIEASTFKPGNVYVGKKGFLDFLVSAVILGGTLEKIRGRDIRLGQFIREAVVDRKKYVSENTNLGIILLHVPIAVAAAQHTGTLRSNLDRIVNATTKEDAEECGEALKISGAFLGKPEKGPDLRFDTGLKEIEKDGVTLLDLFSISSAWDMIASEWVHGFEITFSGAEWLLSGGSILDLYMEILSTYPDSLVLRRFEEKKALEVMQKAKKLKGASLDDLREWDNDLYGEGVNPGTTADLVASSLFAALLKRDDILTEFLNEIHKYY